MALILYIKPRTLAVSMDGEHQVEHGGLEHGGLIWSHDGGGEDDDNDDSHEDINHDCVVSSFIKVSACQDYVIIMSYL